MGITEEQDRNLYSISWKTLPGSIITAHKASPKPLIVSNVSIFFSLTNYKREQYHFHYTTWNNASRLYIFPNDEH